MKTVKRACAWCKEELGTKEGRSSDEDITFGMCSKCAIEVTSFKSRTAKEILNKIHEPVFIVSSGGRIKAANESGQKLLGKGYDEIENALGGDVFECSYASIDDGCGKTEHCKTCAIRNIVMDTLKTGHGFDNVPAFQSIKTDSGTKTIKFLISTERVKQHILLRVDKVVNTTT